MCRLGLRIPSQHTAMMILDLTLVNILSLTEGFQMSMQRLMVTHVRLKRVTAELP